MKSAILLICLSAMAFPQARDPQQQPGRREPGLFQGPRGKGEDETVRSVAGVVRLPNEDPAEGAVVQLKDTKTLRVRSYITKEDGIYRFHGLSTNVDYELKADFKELASDSKTLSVFDSRRQAVINLKLEPKKEKEDK